MEEHVCHLTHALVGLDGQDLRVVNVSCDILEACCIYVLESFVGLVFSQITHVMYIIHVYFLPFVQHIAHHLVWMVVCVLNLLHVNAYLDGLEPFVLMVRLLLITSMTIVTSIATILHKLSTKVLNPRPSNLARKFHPNGALRWKYTFLQANEHNVVKINVQWLRCACVQYCDAQTQWQSRD